MSQSSLMPSQITSGPGTIVELHTSEHDVGSHAVVPTPHAESQLAPPVSSSVEVSQSSSSQLQTSDAGTTSLRHGPKLLVGPHTPGQVLMPSWHGPVFGLPPGIAEHATLNPSH